MKWSLPPHIRWPAFVAGALALQVVSSLVTIYLATTNPSYAVEDDYYRKALRWDETRAQTARNLELGWRLEFDVSLAQAPGDSAMVLVTIRDHDGGPVEGSTVTLEAFPNARADDILRASFISAAGGRYRAELPMRRTGVWEFRYVVTNGASVFTHTEKRYITASGS